MSILVPTVIENDGRAERAYDIYSRLLKDRIIFIGSEINETTANLIVAQLLFLQAEDAKKDIFLYINSPGGSVYDALAIYDTMQYIKPDVSTICIGMAASMGAFLLSSGTKGKRLALRHGQVDPAKDFDRRGALAKGKAKLGGVDGRRGACHSGMKP